MLTGFRDPELLRQALRHRSAGKPNNERLEFLGDLLGFGPVQFLRGYLPLGAVLVRKAGDPEAGVWFST